MGSLSRLVPFSTLHKLLNNPTSALKTESGCSVEMLVSVHTMLQPRRPNRHLVTKKILARSAVDLYGNYENTGTGSSGSKVCRRKVSQVTKNEGY